MSWAWLAHGWPRAVVAKKNPALREDMGKTIRSIGCSLSPAAAGAVGLRGKSWGMVVMGLALGKLCKGRQARTGNHVKTLPWNCRLRRWTYYTEAETTRVQLIDNLCLGRAKIIGFNCLAAEFLRAFVIESTASSAESDS